MILAVLSILLLAYAVFLRKQIRSINRQLDKRLRENTRQPISLELQSRQLNELANNINKCLKAEETLRLSSVREEKRFKELTANISHDLRTPLTAIMGYQQLMEKGELTAEQRKRLQTAEKHAGELRLLIDHFFEYSYLQNAEPSANPERMNLTNIVTECLVSAIPTIENRNLTVHFADTPPIFILADKEMVTRVVQNLIRNCIMHSGGDIEVTLLAQETAVISFRNPVKNPSEIDVERIFDRFYSGGKNGNGNTGNTAGLGLSIVKLLAGKMGGCASAVLADGMLEIRVSLPLFSPVKSV